MWKTAVGHPHTPLHMPHYQIVWTTRSGQTLPNYPNVQNRCPLHSDAHPINFIIRIHALTWPLLLATMPLQTSGGADMPAGDPWISHRMNAVHPEYNFAWRHHASRYVNQITWNRFRGPTFYQSRSGGLVTDKNNDIGLDQRLITKKTSPNGQERARLWKWICHIQNHSYSSLESVIQSNIKHVVLYEQDSSYPDGVPLLTSAGE